MERKIICPVCGEVIPPSGKLMEYCGNCGEVFYAGGDDEQEEYTPRKEKIKTKKPKKSQWSNR